MMNFGLYLLSFVANTLVVLTAPEAALRQYVLVYNASGVVFSLGFFFYFSRSASVFLSRAIAAAFVGACICLSLARSPYEAVLVAYPGFLIFSDYLVTQSFGLRTVNLFRLFSILTAAPFAVAPQWFEVNLTARVMLLALFTVTLAWRARDVERLSVRSPIRFLVGNYLFYNGVLAGLALLVADAEALRLWYLAVQIGLVLILKLLDYSLRRSYSVTPTIRLSVLAASGALPLPLMLVYPDFAALGLFYVGYAGLIYTGRFIRR